MFDLPDAKRVRREDLFAASPRTSRSPSPASESPTDPELEDKVRAHFAALYGLSFDFAPARPLPQTIDQVKEKGACGNGSIATEGERKKAEKHQVDHKSIRNHKAHSDKTAVLPQEEEAFEFRLFSAPSTATNTQAVTQTIILESDAPDVNVNILGETVVTGEGAFLRDRKDPRIWTVSKARGERLEEFRLAAMSGEDILRERGKRWWGCEVPWRVTILKDQNSKSRGPNASGDTVRIDQGPKDMKKKKPGKKTRVVLRMRMRKVEVDKESKEREERDKEVEDKERKTRKNREKKMKQKLRAKAKAQAQTGVVDFAAGSIGDGDLEARDENIAQAVSID